MDMWLDQQNPLTLSPEEVNEHYNHIKKIRRKRNAVSAQNGGINLQQTDTEYTGRNND